MGSKTSSTEQFTSIDNETWERIDEYHRTRNPSEIVVTKSQQFGSVWKLHCKGVTNLHTLQA
ncbi:hypothetical protein KDK_23680 [Dictyobacter kobayashii]|uniref:Uncharacterized protein n=1 Tax=Dictyobacter kobayashii TaxID=2014872 RepID=A0A402AHH3_9CHLR|nr:hypothetical protein KDK_23680 [Dictyobacter kobayashii]